MEKKQSYKPLKNAPKEVLEPSPTGYGFMSVVEKDKEQERENKEANKSLYGMDQETSLQTSDFSTTDNPYFSDQEGV